MSCYFGPRCRTTVIGTVSAALMRTVSDRGAHTLVERAEHRVREHRDHERPEVRRMLRAIWADRGVVRDAGVERYADRAARMRPTVDRHVVAAEDVPSGPGTAVIR